MHNFLRFLSDVYLSISIQILEREGKGENEAEIERERWIDRYIEKVGRDR